VNVVVVSIANLIHELSNGTLVEHRHVNVELKQSWSQEVGKKISGHANANMDSSTYVVVGVADDGRLLANDEKWAIETEKKVANHIGQYLDPPQACHKLTAHEISNSWIIVVEVKCPGAVTKWNDSAYKSTGTHATKMSSEEVMQLTLQLPGLSDYSAQKWEGSVDEQLVDTFIQIAVDQNDDLDDLIGLDAKIALSRIGIGDKNVSNILFGDFKYRLVKYDENDDPVYNSSSGPLGKMLLPEFREEIQSYATDVSGGTDRVYSDPALHEALSNAVAHAHYFEKNGDLVVEVFSNRIVVSNLCDPSSSALANKWLSKEHYTFNAALVEFLRVCHLVEELGRGKRVIYKESIKYGRPQPLVDIGNAGRVTRWSLTIFGGSADDKQLKLLARLREHYKDEQKALMALSLVMWRNKPLSEILDYIGPENKQLVNEVAGGMSGAIWIDEAADMVYLSRWSRLILQQGKDSQKFTPHEEHQLFNFVKKMSQEYHGGIADNKYVRSLANMGDSRSEITQVSNLLKKWVNEGRITKTKGRRYKF